MNRTTPADQWVDHRSFFELSSEMLCTAGFDGWFRATNDSFANALGYEGDELLAEPYVCFVHPEDRESTLAEAAKLAVGDDVLCFENRYRHKDGSYRWLSWSVRADLGEALLYCVVSDVTERREQDAIVVRLFADLERSNTDLAQFAYVASHDLSEPLRMVSSYVQLLADRYAGQLDDDADEFIAYAMDGAARMKLLIDDLLAYARAGGAVAAARRVDCGTIVQSVLADLDCSIVETGVTILVEELPTVDGVPGQLTQIFQNLLVNALKFGTRGEPASIRVSAERMGDAWCFSVRDDGIGIAEQHQKRIFLMFKRLHGRSEYPGTGIGLALCHKIVHRIGGRIWVESELGSGSTFRFTVPDVGAA